MGNLGVRHVSNFQKLYLRAQVELEGVLGLVSMLRELVWSMRMFIVLSRDVTELSEQKRYPPPNTALQVPNFLKSLWLVRDTDG